MRSFKLYIIIFLTSLMISGNFSFIDFKKNNKFSSFSKDELLESIYLFEGIINKENDPSYSDYLAIFSDESELELRMRLISCIEKGFLPCTSNKFCEKILYNNDESLFISLLKSSNGPIFKQNGGGRIFIYVYYNFSIESSNERKKDYDPNIEVPAIIYFDKKYLEVVFQLTRFKEDVNQFGRIQDIIINGTSLFEFVDNYEKSKGIDYDKQCGYK